MFALPCWLRALELLARPSRVEEQKTTHTRRISGIIEQVFRTLVAERQFRVPTSFAGNVEPLAAMAATALSAVSADASGATAEHAAFHGV